MNFSLLSVVISLALFITITTIAAPVASPPTTSALPQAGQAEQVDALFASFINDDAPGGAVMVVQAGQILHQAGYGLADLDEGTPITPETIFHLGSVGKQFTGLGVMLLAEEGLLDYDDPIGDYLPELAHFGDEVTIRRLLHHTAGLPDYYDDETLYEGLFETTDTPTNADALAVLANSDDLLFTPGATFEYSNPGYDMLGSLIEAISGQTYGDFMQERIFDPLDMQHTFSQPNPQRLTDPQLAHGYVREGDLIEAYDSDPLDYIVGSGSFYTTVGDMARYEQGLFSGQLVEPATLAEAFEPAILNDGTEIRYGFGWDVGMHAGEPYMAHAGEWLGFNTYYARFPGQQLAVIILLNRTYDHPELDQLAFEIADLYLPECPAE